MKLFRTPHIRPLIAVASSVLLAVISTPYLYADPNVSVQAGANAAKGDGQPALLFGQMGIFTSVTNTLLFLIGAISVIMIIVGGLRYTTSGGNSTSVTGAKNTILYAIVGLIIAILAFAIVNYVLTTLSGAGVGSPTAT
jgi:hypothetical protein